MGSIGIRIWRNQFNRDTMGCRRTQNGWKHGKPSFAKALCYCTPLHVWVSRPPDGHLVDQDKHSYQYCRSIIRCHSSEIRGLCMMKWPCDMLQNLPYFGKMKTHVLVFFILFYFIFSSNECPGLCRHRPGHSLGVKSKQHKMKNMYYSKNMENYEAFH